jgi:hypothetical protein
MVRGTQTVLDLLSRKWSVGVLYLLARGTRRYSELFYEVGEVSKKALTQALRALERDGLVNRRAFPEVPLRVADAARLEHDVASDDDVRVVGAARAAPRGGARGAGPRRAATPAPGRLSRQSVIFTS